MAPEFHNPISRAIRAEDAAADSLVAAGRPGVFTPMYYHSARKRYYAEPSRGADSLALNSRDFDDPVRRPRVRGFRSCERGQDLQPRF